MTTVNYVGDLVIDSTGPLRKFRLLEGPYLVRQEMLIAVDREEQADEVIEPLKDE
jgi:hypothetical protein